MLNNRQIMMLQTALRKAGLRGKGGDGRYRMLLGQYKQSNGQPVTSCKQLNHYQFEDILAICESYGWQCPGKEADHFRKLAAARGNVASFGQQKAIEHLAGDLGWEEFQLAGMIKRMTNGKATSVAVLTPRQAYHTIEALKNMVSTKTGNKYNSLNEIRDDFGKEATDGQVKQTS
ncbi:MAG: DUF1018 domain-containing protein [Planctomycetes bacterium]|nr:DUF1018 domain-containing protein [Planctomycetota bacterium]